MSYQLQSSGATDIFRAMTMQEAHAAPTKQDYQETRILFRDFCIPPTTTPSITTRGGLIAWRTSVIQRYLSRA